MTEIQRLVKIKILKELLKEYELLAKYNNNGTDYDRYCALDMAIKELEQKPRWIPVSEKLPKKFEEVILSTDKGEVFTADYLGKMDDGTNCFDDNDGMMWVGDVIAWMPLPEPYKAESEEA